MHAFNSSTWEAEACRSEFKASLTYSGTFKKARATQRNSASKGGKRKEKKKKKVKNEFIGIDWVTLSNFINSVYSFSLNLEVYSEASQG